MTEQIKQLRADKSRLDYGPLIKDLGEGLSETNWRIALLGIVCIAHVLWTAYLTLKVLL